MLLRALRQSVSGNDASSKNGYESGKSSSLLEFVLNALTFDVNTLCPPFLLTFEIFNYSVHNFLVDSSASVNVMPLYVMNKINAKRDETDAHIIQLDKTLVHAIRELKNVLIHLSLDHQVHQCINIVIVDIQEAYGVLLSRDWSNKLKG